TRRDIITTLVKRVELQEDQVKIVYRVDLSPFDRRPARGDFERCTARGNAPLSTESEVAGGVSPAPCPAGPMSQNIPNCLVRLAPLWDIYQIIA
ncbi:MAG TPA: hypothetical protein VN541_19925, partial [Tepidisphaeraceae bacterium]|nr:hypothetical protein [Tepidisphaeraceae bacterium]